MTAEPRSTDRWTGEYTSQHDWVGSSSLLGRYGSAGMKISQWETGMTTVEAASSVKSSLNGKKSWFMFDDEIVALGAGITNTTNYNVETIIDNRMLDDAGTWSLSVNGKSITSETTVNDAGYAYIDADDAASGIGYYFPESAAINALNETRTDYRSASDSSYTEDTRITKNFATLWFDHGVNPEDAGYQYVLLPSVSNNKVEEYSANPDIVVLANTTQVQAARDQTIGVTGINFWENSKTSLDFVTSYNQASVTLQEDGDDITLAISDPTMLQNSITLELNRMNLLETISCDPRITVKTTAGGTINLAVNTQNALGASFEVKLKVQASDAEAIDTSNLVSAIASAKAALAEYAGSDGITDASRAALSEAAGTAEYALSYALSQQEINEAVLDLQAAVRIFKASLQEILFKQNFDAATAGAVISNSTDRFESWGVSNASTAKYIEFAGAADDSSNMYAKLVIDQTGSSVSGNMNMWRNLASVSGLDTDLVISFDAKLPDTLSARTIRFRSLPGNSTSHGNLVEFDTSGNARLLGGAATAAVDGEWHNYSFELKFDTQTDTQTITACVDGAKLAEKVYTDIQNVNYFDIIETAATAGIGHQSAMGFDNLYITRLADEDAYAVSADGVTVTTSVGIAPELPEEVTVHYSDSTSGSLDVEWAALDNVSYSSAGVFTVWGVVSGTEIEVCATITVTDI